MSDDVRVRPCPKPTRKQRKARGGKKRAVVLKQLEDMCRMLVFWRDGMQCVEKDMDGGRCGGALQWGHFIPRSQSGYLKYDIGNTFAQCQNHNNLHDKGSQMMGAWFAKVFGQEASEHLNILASQHSGKNYKQISITEAEELIAHYEELYQNRFYAPLDDLRAMIATGYYGKEMAEFFDPQDIGSAVVATFGNR